MAETITEELVNSIRHRLDEEAFDVNKLYQTDIRIDMHFEKFRKGLFIEQVTIKECNLLFWLCTRNDDKYSDVLDKILNNKRCELNTEFVWSYTDDSPEVDKVPYTDDSLEADEVPYTDDSPEADEVPYTDDSSDAGNSSEDISSLRAAVSMGNYDLTKKLLQGGARTEESRRLDDSGDRSRVWIPSLLLLK